MNSLAVTLKESQRKEKKKDDALCSSKGEFAGLLVLGKRIICFCSLPFPREPMLCQPVVSSVLPLEMAVRLTRTAFRNQAGC